MNQPTQTLNIQDSDAVKALKVAIVSGLMQVQLSSGIPVFSAVLTPHNFHEHEDHFKFFAQHFTEKGTEVARACLETVASLENVAKRCA